MLIRSASVIDKNVLSNHSDKIFRVIVNNIEEFLNLSYLIN